MKISRFKMLSHRATWDIRHGEVVEVNTRILFILSCSLCCCALSASARCLWLVVTFRSWSSREKNVCYRHYHPTHISATSDLWNIVENVVYARWARRFGGELGESRKSLWWTRNDFGFINLRVVEVSTDCVAWAEIDFLLFSIHSRLNLTCP